MSGVPRPKPLNTDQFKQQPLLSPEEIHALESRENEMADLANLMTDVPYQSRRFNTNSRRGRSDGW